MATGLATLLGGALALRLRSSLGLFLGFGAGAVLGVALFDLLPEAFELTGRIGDPLAVLAALACGFAAYLLLDRGLFVLTQRGRRGHLGAATLTTHSLMDGLGVGLAFQVSPSVGLIVAVGVLTHDFLDGSNTVTLSLSGNGKSRTALGWLCADALAPAAGIGLSRLIAVKQAELGVLLAMFSGFFLYIGASELLPQAHARRPLFSTAAATVAGLGLMYSAVRLAGG